MLGAVQKMRFKHMHFLHVLHVNLSESAQPVALLFAKHKLYRYSGSESSADLLGFVRKALDGELQGEQIPAERSFFDKCLGETPL